MSAEKEVTFRLFVKNMMGGGLADAQKQMQGFMAGLKRQAGEESVLGQAGKVLAGGGMVAGATLVARQIGVAADAITGLIQKYREGEMSAAEMFSEIGRNLPVLGTFVKMWDSLGDTVKSALGFKTAKQELAELNAQIDTLNKRTAEITAEKAHSAKLWGAGGLADQARKQLAASAMSPDEREIQAIKDKWAKVAEQLRAEFEAAGGRGDRGKLNSLLGDIDKQSSDEVRQLLAKKREESDAEIRKLVATEQAERERARERHLREQQADAAAMRSGLADQLGAEDRARAQALAEAQQRETIRATVGASAVSGQYLGIAEEAQRNAERNAPIVNVEKRMEELVKTAAEQKAAVERAARAQEEMVQIWRVAAPFPIG